MEARLQDNDKTTGDPGVLRLVKETSATPDRVWRCLTDTDCLKAWWRRNVEFDPREGGSFLEPWQDPSGRGRTVRAQVTTFHPPQGLVMVWADDDWTFDTVVSFWIEPHADGSLVTIEHQGWMAAPEPERLGLLDEHRAGWGRHLDNWAAHAEDTEAH